MALQATAPTPQDPEKRDFTYIKYGRAADFAALPKNSLKMLCKLWKAHSIFLLVRHVKDDMAHCLNFDYTTP